LGFSPNNNHDVSGQLFFSIYKLLATKTDGRRSTYLQFEEDRRGLDHFFGGIGRAYSGCVGELQIGGIGITRGVQIGRGNFCPGGGGEEAQGGVEAQGGAGSADQEGGNFSQEWEEATGNLPQIKEAAGGCSGGGGDGGADRSRTPLPPSPHHHVRGALSGGRPRKRMHLSRSERKEQGGRALVYRAIGHALSGHNLNAIH